VLALYERMSLDFKYLGPKSSNLIPTADSVIAVLLYQNTAVFFQFLLAVACPYVGVDAWATCSGPCKL
jgi:hypothetical protein